MMIISFATAFFVHHLPETNGQRMGEVTPATEEDEKNKDQEQNDKYQILT